MAGVGGGSSSDPKLFTSSEGLAWEHPGSFQGVLSCLGVKSQLILDWTF